MLDWNWIIGIITGVILWLHIHGFNLDHIIAGFFGATVRSIVSKTGTIIERLISGATGAIFAVYFTPVIATLLVVDPTMSSAVAFSIGLVGVYVAEGVMKVFKGYADNPKKVIGLVKSYIAKVLNIQGK